MQNTVRSLDEHVGRQAARRFRMALDFLENEATQNGWDRTARQLCAARDALADDLGIGSAPAKLNGETSFTETNHG